MSDNLWKLKIRMCFNSVKNTDTTMKLIEVMNASDAAVVVEHP